MHPGCSCRRSVIWRIQKGSDLTSIEQVSAALQNDLGGSGSSFEGYRLRRPRRDGRGFARDWALSLRRPLAPDFRKEGTRCPIRVAMLAVDRGAINRLFCFVLRARGELGKIDFDIHGPSLCLDVDVVNSKRLPDAWIGEAGTIADD